MGETRVNSPGVGGVRTLASTGVGGVRTLASTRVGPEGRSKGKRKVGSVFGKSTNKIYCAPGRRQRV